MSTYKIEKDVFMPKQTNKYPLWDMEIGDSFSFPMKERVNIAGTASAYARRSNKKWSTRKINDRLGRIWRIK